MRLKDIGVVIPAYNVEKTIDKLSQQLIDYGFDRENIIVINDGSQDETSKIVKGFGLCVVSHKKKYGQGYGTEAWI